MTGETINLTSKPTTDLSPLSPSLELFNPCLPAGKEGEASGGSFVLQESVTVTLRESAGGSEQQVVTASIQCDWTGQKSS